jgi:hypothetical protein
MMLKTLCRTLFLLALLPCGQAAFAADMQPPLSVQTAKMPWSLTHTKDGGLRFEVRPFENVAEIGDTGRAIERSEIVVGNTKFNHVMATSWTFTWHQVAGEPVPKQKYAWLGVGQWHILKEPGDVSVSPAIGFDLSGGELKVCIRTTDEKPLKAIPAPNCLYRTKIAQDRPYRLDQQVKFTPDTRNGLFKVWIDGVLVINYQGRLGYKTQNPPYLKVGIYRSHTNDIDSITYEGLSLRQVE